MDTPPPERTPAPRALQDREPPCTKRRRPVFMDWAGCGSAMEEEEDMATAGWEVEQE